MIKSKGVWVLIVVLFLVMIMPLIVNSANISLKSPLQSSFSVSSIDNLDKASMLDELGSSNKIDKKVLDELKIEDRVRVGVILNDDIAGKLDKKKIKDKQDSVLNLFDKKNFKLLNKYETISALGLEVNVKALSKLTNSDLVKFIHEDRIATINLAESAPLIEAPYVWNTLGYTGEGVAVCVIDTGVDYTHPALGGCFGDGCTVLAGYDFVNSDSDPIDDNGHGTHVSGIVTSDNVTYRGIAPDAGIIAIKACNSAGSCFELNYAAGVDWCVAHKDEYNIKVITMSLGGGNYNSSSQCDNHLAGIAINNAVSQGIFVDVSSGNDGSITGISDPACVSGAVSVGATYDADVGGWTYCVEGHWNGPNWVCDRDCTDAITFADNITCYSNRASILDLLAPGSPIMSTKLGGGFEIKHGTSMSAPMVAGLAALMYQKNPYLLPIGVENIMKQTGKPIYDSGTGLTFPRVNASGAVENAPGGHLEAYNVTGNTDAAQNSTFSFTSGVRCLGGDCGDVDGKLRLFLNSTTCSQVWGFNCGNNPDSDNTFDSCSTAGHPSGESYDEHIEEIYLDKSLVGFGEEIEVKCDFELDSVSCGGGYYTDDRLYIYYRNSSTGSWRKIKYVSQVYPCNNYSVSFVPDNVEGEHQIRCITGWIIPEGECVSGDYWYDNDDINFTVYRDIISTNPGDKPFYTTSSQPQSCGDMQEDDECELTWNVNATGDFGIYPFFTIFNSSYPIPQVETGKVNVTITNQTPAEVISITLEGDYDYGINFSSLGPGTNNAPANGNGNYVVHVESNAGNIDLYQSGTNFSVGENNFVINNMKWFNSSNIGSAFIMQNGFNEKISEISNNANVSVYYWLSIPSSQAAANNYQSQITITAVKSGNPAPAGMGMYIPSSESSNINTPVFIEETLEQEAKEPTKLNNNDDTIYLNKKSASVDVIKLN